MLTSRSLWLTLASLVTLAVIGIAQAQTPPGGDNTGGRRGRRQPPTAEEMKKYQEQRQAEAQKQLGATEEEFKAISPKLQKVRDAQQALRGSMTGNRFGGGRFGGGRQPGATPDTTAGADKPKPTPIEAARDALQKVVDNKDAKPEEIKKALTDLQAARAKAKTELEKAQKELREILTQRQEALLVLQGVLE